MEFSSCVKKPRLGDGFYSDVKDSYRAYEFLYGVGSYLSGFGDLPTGELNAPNFDINIWTDSLFCVKVKSGFVL